MFILLFNLISCKKESSNEVSKNVTLNTSGIFIPVTLKYNNVLIENELIDLDEYELGKEKVQFSIQVTNNTDFPITELSAAFIDQDVTDETFHFQLNDDNESLFPGSGGTCIGKINSGQTCSIEFEIEAPIELGPRLLDQVIRVHYKNLVQEDNLDFHVKINVGYPASLIFVGESGSDFYFGDKVTIRQIPVVERSIPRTFHKQFTIKNVGDLRARSITPIVEQLKCEGTIALVNCDSMDSNFKDTYLESAWRYETSCPSTLYKDESCTLDVYFDVKNQDTNDNTLNQVLAELKYDFQSSIKYNATPSLDEKGLNAYITTTSTDIAAYFETTVKVIEIPDPVVVGNRAFSLFRIDNKGYAAGLINKVLIYDPADMVGFISPPAANINPLAVCIADGNNGIYLSCYTDDNLDTKTNLTTFPFLIEDTDTCVSTSSVDHFVPADNSCLFRISVQPSVSIDTETEYGLSLWINYDSRLKDSEHLVIGSMIEEFKFTSNSAAKLEITGITYLGANTITAVTPEILADFNRMQTFDMGRLALILPAYSTYYDLSIDFKNIGQASAKNLSAFFGQNGGAAGTAIPLDTGGVTGLDIGQNSNNPFYKEVKMGASCSEVLTDGTCSITMKFSPLALGDTCNESSSMYDFHSCTEDIDVRKTFYKQFSIYYDDGSLYTDDAINDTVKNVVDRKSEVKIYSLLLKKGYLATFHDQFFLNAGVFGSKQNYSIAFTNVGSGSIPYISAANGSRFEALETEGLYIVKTEASDLTTAGAQHDCLDIFDFNTESTSYAAITANRVVSNPDPLNITDRKNHWQNGGLPSGDSCIFKFELNPQTSMAQSTFSQGDVYSFPIANFDPLNSQAAWQNKTLILPVTPITVAGTTLLDVFYYDGDIQSLTVTDDIIDHYGSRFDANNSLLQSLELASTFSLPGKLSIQGGDPSTSSVTLHKEDFTDAYAGLLSISIFDSILPSIVNGFTGKFGYINSSQNYDFDIKPADIALARLINIDMADLDNTPGSFTASLGTFNKSIPVTGSFFIVESGSTTYYPENAESFISGDGCLTLTGSAAPPAGAAPVPVFPPGTIPSVAFSISSPAGAVFTNGLYKCEGTYSLQYYNNTFDTSSNYIPGDDNFSMQSLQTLSVKVIAWIEDDTGAPAFKFKLQDYQISSYPPQTNRPAADVSLNVGTTDIGFSYAGEGTAEELKFEAVTLNDVSITSFDNTEYYVKKRLWIENMTNTIYGPSDNLIGFRFGNRISTNQFDLNTLSDYIQFDAAAGDPSGCGHTNFNLSLNVLDFPQSNGGTDERFLSSFPANSSCYVDIIYQPRTLGSGDTEETIDFYILHALKTGDIIEQKITLVFNEVPPAYIQPVGLSQLGNTYLLNVSNQAITAGLSFQQEVRLINIANTNASFVHQWINFKGFTLTTGGVPNLPDFVNCTGVDIGVDCIETSEIFRLSSKQTVYDGSIVLGETSAFLSEACFIGDDEGVLNWSQKGLNSGTTIHCKMIAKFIPTINTYKATSNISSVDSYLFNMSKFGLTYYDYNRGSYKELSLAFDGKLEPSLSAFTISGGESEVYEQLQVSQNKEVEFSWNAFTANDTIEFGDIVGYRVYIAETKNVLDNLYILKDKLTRDFIDVRTINALNNFANFMTANFKAYHYRVAAIRYHVDYEHPWTELNLGEYISYDDSLSVLSIVTPGVGYKYEHIGKRLYRTENELFANDNEDNTYHLRRAVCESFFQVSVGSGEIGLYQAKMLDLDGRDFLIDNTDYSCEGSTCYDFGDEAVWLDAPFMSVAQYGFSAMDGFSSPATPLPDNVPRVLYTNVGSNPPHSYLVGEGALDSEAFLMSKPLGQIYGRFLIDSQPVGVYGILDLDIPLATSRCFVDLNDRLN